MGASEASSGLDRHWCTECCIRDMLHWPHWLLLQFTLWLPFGLYNIGFTSSALNTPDSCHFGWCMSLHTTPHCSPHWPTLHFPVNEFNGLRSDSHELLHVIGGWQCSLWVHRGTTDICSGFSSLLFTQWLTLRSHGFFVCFRFVLCFAFPQQDSHPYHGLFFCQTKRKRRRKGKSEHFPTYLVKKPRQFAPHYS